MSEFEYWNIAYFIFSWRYLNAFRDPKNVKNIEKMIFYI